MIPITAGTLFVEAKLTASTKRDPFIRTDELRHSIDSWLRENFIEVKVGQELDLSSFSSKEAIESLYITGHSKTRQFPDEQCHSLDKNRFDIAIYSLYADSDDESDTMAQEDEDESATSHHFTITRLPHRNLDGLWESLIYGEPIGEYTLRTLTRAITELQRTQLGLSSSCLWQNTVLLHGPPGSGKTTLAQALAQRLSIRLCNLYGSANLVNVKSHTLFSRYFGESSKQIGRLFESIAQMAGDDSQLTVVIFDEIETVAGSREKASQTNEVGDAIRSTNELLQGLDRFRRSANVVFICTSNLVENIDAAFVDRCFLKELVAAPVVECVFEILRCEINGLVKQGIVVFDGAISSGEKDRNSITAESPSSANSNIEDDEALSLVADEGQDLSGLPSTSPSKQAYGDNGRRTKHGLVGIPRWSGLSGHARGTVVSDVHRIAELGKGLSGRKIKGLVTLARYKHIVDEPCDVQELLQAVEKVFRQETGSSLANEEEEAVGSQRGRDLYEDITRFLGEH